MDSKEAQTAFAPLNERKTARRELARARRPINESVSANPTNAEFLLLSEAEAAKRLRCSRACLRHWRTVGKGPPWIRLGDRLIRYPLTALLRWIEDLAGVGDGQ
jgi:hypothetical protein